MVALGQFLSLDTHHSHQQMASWHLGIVFWTFKQHCPLQILTTSLAVCLTIECPKLGLFTLLVFPAEELQSAVVGYTQVSDSAIPICFLNRPHFEFEAHLSRTIIIPIPSSTPIALVYGVNQFHHFHHQPASTATIIDRCSRRRCSGDGSTCCTRTYLEDSSQKAVISS